jgi:hypothetical protein
VAYPFAQMPTVDEFVQWAVESGAKVVSLEDMGGSMQGPRGKVAVRYLVQGEGQPFVVPDPPGSRMTPTQVRIGCDRLGLPVAHWGFTAENLHDGTFQPPKAKA